MRGGVLWALLLVFTPLSFATIGGGQGIVAELHRQSVSVQHWMTDEQFLADYAISRLAPGPGSLLVTLLGWQAAGWQGALIASIAIFLPSSLLLYVLARIWQRYRGHAGLRALERGLAPIAAGMIIAAAITVLQAAAGGWRAWVVAGVATLLLSATRISPFLTLGLGGLVFLVTT